MGAAINGCHHEWHREIDLPSETFRGFCRSVYEFDQNNKGKAIINPSGLHPLHSGFSLAFNQLHLALATQLTLTRNTDVQLMSLQQICSDCSIEDCRIGHSIDSSTDFTGLCKYNNVEFRAEELAL
jgi:hypothetical protein